MATPRERLYNRILGHEPGHNGIPIPVEDVEMILDWAVEFFTTSMREAERELAAIAVIIGGDYDSPLPISSRVKATLHAAWTEAYRSRQQAKDAEQQLAEAGERVERLRELAERAVVAMHMHCHAGISKPGFDDCRDNLCGDWHALQPSAAAAAEGASHG